jgi:hypothetical protein
MRGKFIDLTGQKTGLLTARKRVDSDKHGKVKWECLCDCGNTVDVIASRFNTGKTRSCGCLRVLRTIQRCTTHGDANHHHRTAEYRAWLGMKARCFKPTTTEYHRYGGRGITVCERWKTSFKSFLQDLGRKPSKRHSLDRFDNDGDYEPGNCRWATRKQQNKNKTFGYGNCKLTDIQVRQIRAILASGQRQSSIALRFKICETTICNINTGKAYRRVD